MQKTRREIPAPSSFVQPRKTGYLRKYIQRTWFLPGSWKRRFCILNGNKMYTYENEGCKGTEKSSGVINLDYYDLCLEGGTKESKRASNVFIITSSVLGCFEKQHLFSAESLPEMTEWLKTINEAIADERHDQSKASHKKVKGKQKKEYLRPRSADNSPIFQVTTIRHTSDGSLELPSGERLYTPTKHRDRGPRGRRLPQRKTVITTLGGEYDLRYRASSLSELENVDFDRNGPWLYSSSDISVPRRTNSGSALAFQHSSSEGSDIEGAFGTTTLNQNFSYT
ncbi:src kinase-associated phosphoprotein 2-A-like isoform X1 [Limulus polyphemus]|uniref:Src kinase-associated phosphoprotein 2-A-like isoform X1 n=1 Tax=Limulus polyphemus TaxID=6850 RepID=A0ABM1BAE6_LIMPO|nr:src kinase-associated phosphoprotein 2-A-like isoform X1 [Limulus polyphemus]